MKTSGNNPFMSWKYMDDGLRAQIGPELVSHEVPSAKLPIIRSTRIVSLPLHTVVSFVRTDALIWSLTVVVCVSYLADCRSHSSVEYEPSVSKMIASSFCVHSLFAARKPTVGDNRVARWPRWLCRSVPARSKPRALCTCPSAFGGPRVASHDAGERSV